MYEVTVGKHPDCTCPDFQKGNICKHYLFVMLRVLRLDRADPLVWQKALVKSEVTLLLCFNVLGTDRGPTDRIQHINKHSLICQVYTIDFLSENTL